MARKENNEFIDFGALWRQYRRNWYWFVVSIVLCGALAFGYTKVRHLKYAVVANLLINPDQTDITDPSSSIAAMFGSNGQVDDEIFIVSSHSLYCKVAEELGINVSHTVRKNLLRSDYMFDKYPVGVRTTAGIYDTLSSTIKFRVNLNEKGLANIRAKVDRNVIAEAKDVKLPYTLALPYGEFTFSTTDNYHPGHKLNTDINVSGYHATAEMLSENVSADIASKLSNVIQLRMETPYVDYGKAVLNKIIELYNERGIQESANMNEMTARFLDQRLDMVARDLSSAEKQIQNYKESNGIVDVSHETLYQSTRRAQLDEELVRAQTAMNIIGMIHDFVSDPAHRHKMIPALGLSEELAQGFSESLSQPIKTYNELITKRIELTRSAKPGNRQLQILDEQIATQQANLISSINQARAEATRSMADLEKEMDKSQVYLSGVPRQEREFVELTRQNTVKQELYLFLLQKREEVSMMIAKSIPKGQIIDQAYTMGEPIGTKKRMIWLMGLVLGAMIVPVVLYVRQLIRNRFETRSDVERTVDTPVIGEICTDKTDGSFVMTTDGPSAEMFRLLRSNLMFLLGNPADKTILVTSAVEGEGKTFVAINLAASIAQMGKRVVLVGMDIRNPRLALDLNLKTAPGLTQYLASASTSLDPIISHDVKVPGLDVIVAGPVPPNPAELLLSGKVDDMIEMLRDRYDYIVIDSAPVTVVSDTFALNRVADTTLFVCRAHHTKFNELREVDTLNKENRLKRINIVVNGTEPLHRYGYGHSN